MAIGIRVLTALLILGSPFILGQWMRRRGELAPTWLTTGVLLFMGAFIARTLLFFIFPTILLNNPVFGGVSIGLTIALTDTLARVIGYQTIAQEAVYREHAYLIGVGYAVLPLLSTGFGLLFDGVSHLYQGNGADISLGVSLAELLIAVASLILYMALSWLVLQAFIRGQLGWIFASMLWSGMVAGTQAFILNGSLQPILVNSVWWSIVALISMAILYFVQAPPDFRWRNEIIHLGEVVNDE